MQRTQGQVAIGDRRLAVGGRQPLLDLRWQILTTAARRRRDDPSRRDGRTALRQLQELRVDRDLETVSPEQALGGVVSAAGRARRGGRRATIEKRPSTCCILPDQPPVTPPWQARQRTADHHLAAEKGRSLPVTTPPLDLAELHRYAMERPGTSDGYPFGPGALVCKVRGKMFALFAVDDEPLTVNLKCEPELAEILRASHDAVAPGYHMNKRHWITVTVDGSVDQELLGWIDDSYDLVVDGLPAAVRAELRPA